MAILEKKTVYLYQGIQYSLSTVYFFILLYTNYYQYKFLKIITQNANIFITKNKIQIKKTLEELKLKI